MSTVVTMELPDAALAADVVDGLAQVEEGLREAAQAEHELLAKTSRYLIERGRQEVPRHAGAAGGPVRRLPGTSGSCPRRWRSSSPTWPRSTTTT